RKRGFFTPFPLREGGRGVRWGVVGEGLSADELHDLLRAGDLVVLLPADGALDAVELLLDGEVELDAQSVRFLVDEFGGALAAAAVVAEEGERDGIEDARLAAA